ncbi:uncharacterized protein CDAR_407911 [Caerostris darwini]|uniref:Ig-like domain-containing protein n=1 Tax=Caerostris darwini TaxID=1538125 RepID=A0AAV4WE11_9ARAC|nr:uncharacterized protein CDAR_407911 [Caerostris darwini]
MRPFLLKRNEIQVENANCKRLIMAHEMALPDFRLSLQVVCLQLSKSGRSTVYLTNVTLETEGRFTCQVSADEPNPTLDVYKCTETYLFTVMPPEESPEISGEFTDYGENLTIRCLSAKSKPAANLSWYINDVIVSTNGTLIVHLEVPFLGP